MTDPKLSAAKLRRRARRSPQPEPLLPDHESSSETASFSCEDSITSIKKSTANPAQDDHIRAILRPRPRPTLLPPLTHHQPPPMSITKPTSLLLTSLGNPAPLHTTRHSAGHILLKALASQLQCPPFIRSKPHASGHITRSRNSNINFTLWQSPSLMNISGPAVLKAWKTFISEHNKDETALGLVVLHDELETPPGTLRVRRGMQGSVKGHNGLKSVFGSFEGAGLKAGMEGRLVRVGVGIGRPAGGGRGKEEVSNFVLAQCTGREREGIEGLVGRLVGVCEEHGGFVAEGGR